MSAKPQPALRISQLDSSELDSELLELLKSQLTSAFQYFKPGLLARYLPEISAALKLIIWKYTIDATGSTVGQKLLDISYQPENHTPEQNGLLGKQQRALYAALTILLPWLQERSPDIAIATRDYRYAETIWQALKLVERGWKVLALLNFIIFLQKGQYQFITERLLGIRAYFNRPQALRQVGFEYMDRELLWHGFAEFLFFVLPLINFRRIKNYMSQRLLPWQPAQDGDCLSSENLKECVICEEWPYNPHQIGCSHVFCYYCIYSNLEADLSYRCPVCGTSPESMDDVKPVIRTVSRTTS